MGIQAPLFAVRRCNSITQICHLPEAEAESEPEPEPEPEPETEPEPEPEPETEPERFVSSW